MGLGIICQIAGIYVPDAETGAFSLLPSFSSFSVGDLSKTFGQCFNVEFGSIKITDFVVVVFVFLFSDLFDTLGTIIGVANEAKMLDKDGKNAENKASIACGFDSDLCGCSVRYFNNNNFCREFGRYI